MKFISKTKYLEGLQCPKLLWYEYNCKSEIPEPDALTKSVMEEGQRVGKFAHQLFPDGVVVEREWVPEKMHEKSLRVLKERRPTFEAGFVFERAYAIADILVPVENDAWDLIEVKSASGIKDTYYNDVAFQKYTYTGAGLKIRNGYLMHLDREYIKKGKIDVEKLFKKEEISAVVDDRIPAIKTELNAMLKTIEQKSAPEVKVGQQCSGCLLQELCWRFLPEVDHVFILHRGDKTAYRLMEQGIYNVRDIPEDYELSERHALQRMAVLSGKTHIDKAALKHFLDQLKYPLYYLDFETMAPAMPIYDQTHPYEEVPFQFSLHIVKEEGGEIAHHSYLAPGEDDPRPEILKLLKNLLGTEGSIVAYNAAYEAKCIKAATEAYTGYKPWFKSIEKRFVDLWEPFKNFYYYHPGQQESTSMKSVLPTFAGTNHAALDISEGWTARMEYMRIAFEKEVDEKEKERIRNALKQYCELDTKGMIEIIEALQGEIDR